MLESVQLLDDDVQTPIPQDCNSKAYDWAEADFYLETDWIQRQREGVVHPMLSPLTPCLYFTQVRVTMVGAGAACAWELGGPERAYSLLKAFCN